MCIRYAIVKLCGRQPYMIQLSRLNNVCNDILGAVPNGHHKREQLLNADSVGCRSLALRCISVLPAIRQRIEYFPVSFVVLYITNYY